MTNWNAFYKLFSVVQTCHCRTSTVCVVAITLKYSTGSLVALARLSPSKKNKKLTHAKLLIMYDNLVGNYNNKCPYFITGACGSGQKTYQHREVPFILMTFNMLGLPSK